MKTQIKKTTTRFKKSRNYVRTKQNGSTEFVVKQI